MPFAPFHNFFPELAERETRTITVIDGRDWGVPADQYALLELYCNERKCDCRRVFFMVVTPSCEEPLAVIEYGWESADYYDRWMGGFDSAMAERATGTALVPFGHQSKLAPAILRMVEELVLRDEAYVERLKKHYTMVRRHVDGAPIWRLDPAERKQRERLRRTKMKTARKGKRRGRPARRG